MSICLMAEAFLSTFHTHSFTLLSAVDHFNMVNTTNRTDGFPKNEDGWTRVTLIGRSAMASFI